MLQAPPMDPSQENLAALAHFLKQTLDPNARKLGRYFLPSPFNNPFTLPFLPPLPLCFVARLVPVWSLCFLNSNQGVDSLSMHGFLPRSICTRTLWRSFKDF